MNRPRLIDTLQRHEGRELQPYQDSVGVWTVGHGHNLEAKPISVAAAELILNDDILDATESARAVVSSFDALNDVRREALVNMAFQLGQAGLAGFVKMLQAIAAKDWPKAADEALESLWARQTPARAKEIASMLRTGEMLDE